MCMRKLHRYDSRRPVAKSLQRGSVYISSIPTVASDPSMFSLCKSCCAHVQQRWIFAVMGCLAITNAYAMRIILSLAITEMVKPGGNASNETSTSAFSGWTGGQTYKWDEYTQGVILSSFFWGYFVTQIPGGLLSEKFGGKHILGLGIFSTAVFTIFTPIIVHIYGSTGLIVLRVLMGLGEGTTYPATSVLISKWAPPNERSKIGAMVSSGAAMGIVLGNGLSGVLIEYSPIGWPIVFYFFGALGVLWFVVWTALCYSNPDTHPFIQEEERKYLHEAMDEHTHRESPPTPWRQIITSVPIRALVAGKFGFSWGFYTLSSDLPKYMNSVLKFSIKANGFLTALPYVVMLVTSNTSSWPADWLVKSKRMSRTNVRKIWFTISMIAPAIFIVVAAHAGSDRTVVVTLLTVAVALMGPTYSSLSLNPNDLSPNFSGTIMAIANMFGTVAGILAPYVVGILTPNQSISEWRIVFWITFVISWLSTLIFDIWAQGKVQVWNDLAAGTNQENEEEVKMDTLRGSATSIDQS